MNNTDANFESNHVIFEQATNGMTTEQRESFTQRVLGAVMGMMPVATFARCVGAQIEGKKTGVVLSVKAAKACQKYTLAVCLKAYKQHKEGNGARTIGLELGLTTNAADAAINAGREYTVFTTGKE